MSEQPDDALTSLRPWQRASATTHVLVALAVGLIVGVAARLATTWTHGGLIGWVAAASTFLVWTWATLWPLDAACTQAIARREDPSRPVRDLVLVAVAAGSVIAVALVIVPAGRDDWLLVCLGVVCIVVSWTVVHTVFMLTYARQYYSDPVGGIDFLADHEKPSYRDFAYVAFTVGMTFQVSDTTVRKTEIRTTVLRQALMSFLFGAIIIAVTINIIASLSRS